MNDCFKQSIEIYKKKSIKSDYLRRTNTRFVSEVVEDTSKIQQLFVAAACLMEYGFISRRPSSIEWCEEEYLLVTALTDLIKNFYYVVCIAETRNN